MTTINASSAEIKGSQSVCSAAHPLFGLKAGSRFFVAVNGTRDR